MAKPKCKAGSTSKFCRKPSRGDRSDFALPGGRFPLNKPGRVAAAPGLAAYSFKKGNITAAQKATVDRKAAAKRR